jgi:hypothetical protein
MRHIVITTATAMIAGGAVLSAANAADLYTTPPPVAEAPPPAEEAPPPVAQVAPPAIVVVPQRGIVVEPGCPTVWRCGYWGCGWRAACAPVKADVYGVAPYWRHRIYGYGEYYRPNWGHSHPRWGRWHHGEG